MRILHVVDSLPRENGGMPAVVVRLAVAQAAAGLTPTVTCHDERVLKEHVQWWSSEVLGFAAVEVVPCSLRPSRLAQLLTNFDVVHVHGVWTPVPTLACWQAERLGMPIIVAPHGMLSAWSLAQKRTKKAIWLALVWRHLLAGATALHALNTDESEELHSRFPGVNIRVIANGVFPEEFAELPPAGDSARVVPSTIGRRYILFLARLHYMKGPDLLVQAFSRIAERIPDLDLVVAGPDYGMAAPLEEAIAKAGLTGRVHLPGAVYGRAKLALLRDAVCMCQPSRHEGFSVSMLEALACGLPVVTTRTANFPEIETEGIGIIANPDPVSLAHAIVRVATEAGLREKQSRAGREFVFRSYTWAAVERRAREVYAEVIESAAAARRPIIGVHGT